MRFLSDDIKTILSAYTLALITYSESVTYAKWADITHTTDTCVAVEPGTNQVLVLITSGDFEIGDSITDGTNVAVVDTITKYEPTIAVKGDNSNAHNDDGSIIINAVQLNNSTKEFNYRHDMYRADLEVNNSPQSSSALKKRILEIVDYICQYEFRLLPEDRALGDGSDGPDYIMKMLYNDTSDFKDKQMSIFLDVKHKWVAE